MAKYFMSIHFVARFGSFNHRGHGGSQRKSLAGEVPRGICAFFVVQFIALTHRQHDAEPGLAGDHLLVGVSGFLQRIALDHGANSAQ